MRDACGNSILGVGFGASVYQVLQTVCGGGKFLGVVFCRPAVAYNCHKGPVNSCDTVQKMNPHTFNCFLSIYTDLFCWESSAVISPHTYSSTSTPPPPPPYNRELLLSGCFFACERPPVSCTPRHFCGMCIYILCLFYGTFFVLLRYYFSRESFIEMSRLGAG